MKTLFVLDENVTEDLINDAVEKVHQLYSEYDVKVMTIEKSEFKEALNSLYYVSDILNKLSEADYIYLGEGCKSSILNQIIGHYVNEFHLNIINK